MRAVLTVFSVFSVLTVLTVLTVFTVVLIFSRFEDPCFVKRRIPTHKGVIEIVGDLCQDGLPHTTGPQTIRMTQSVYDSARRDEILKHERVHLEQKLNPRKWEEFYRNWKYTLFSHPPPDLPHELRSNVRPNPDTSVQPWAVWNDRYLFFPVYTSSSLRNAKVIVWDLQEKRVVALPGAWRTMFCTEGTCPNQFEHPHEIAAEYITLGSSSIAAEKLFQWLN